jgi:hypothetical protein
MACDCRAPATGGLNKSQLPNSSFQITPQFTRGKAILASEEDKRVAAPDAGIFVHAVAIDRRT